MASKPLFASPEEDLRQGVTPAGHAALDELEAMDSETDASRAIGRAMADIEQALATTRASLTAQRCVLAAARLIRAADILAGAQSEEVE